MPTLFPFTTAFRAADLPDPQRLALEALLQGRTKAETAQHARTSERTLRRWLRDPRFTAALRQARCDAWIETTTALQRLNRNALTALERVLDSDNPRAQVYAAKTVLLLTVKALDVEAMCGRIAQAEADLEAHLNGGTKPTFYSDSEDEDGNEDPGSASDPTVPVPAGTPQGDGSGGMHPVAAPAPSPRSVNRSHDGDPTPEVSSTTVRESLPRSAHLPEPVKAGQIRPRLREPGGRLPTEPRSSSLGGMWAPVQVPTARPHTSRGPRPRNPRRERRGPIPSRRWNPPPATPTPSQGHGPATSQPPSRDPGLSAYERDRHAPGKARAHNDRGNGLTAETGQIRSKPAMRRRLPLAPSPRLSLFRAFPRLSAGHSFFRVLSRVSRAPSPLRPASSGE